MFGDLGKIMKLAGQMKTALPAMQEKLAEAQHTATAGGGMVKATVNGKLMLTDLQIDRQLLADAQGDSLLLESFIKSAVAAAQDKAATAAAEAMKELTGGANLPGLDAFMK